MTCKLENRLLGRDALQVVDGSTGRTVAKPDAWQVCYPLSGPWSSSRSPCTSPPPGFLAGAGRSSRPRRCGRRVVVAFEQVATPTVLALADVASVDDLWHVVGFREPARTFRPRLHLLGPRLRYRRGIGISDGGAGLCCGRRCVALRVRRNGRRRLLWGRLPPQHRAQLRELLALLRGDLEQRVEVSL